VSAGRLMHDCACSPVVDDKLLGVGVVVDLDDVELVARERHQPVAWLVGARVAREVVVRPRTEVLNAVADPAAPAAEAVAEPQELAAVSEVAQVIGRTEQDGGLPLARLKPPRLGAKGALGQRQVLQQVRDVGTRRVRGRDLFQFLAERCDLVASDVGRYIRGVEANAALGHCSEGTPPRQLRFGSAGIIVTSPCSSTETTYRFAAPDTRNGLRNDFP
jgi:hypothetical protein